MIGAPSDIKQEIDIVKEALHEWNDLNTQRNQIVLLPKHWASSTYPVAGDRPQDSINKQLVANSDMLIGIFGSKLGTPTGKAISGTVEEIEEHVKAGKPVMVFFKRTGDTYNVDADQLKRIQEYRESIKDYVYWEVYDNEEKFKEIFPKRLQLFLNDTWLKDNESQDASVNDGLYNPKDYWLKLVAGEKKGSETSPRLKSFLKRLTSKDAERIQKICPYVFYFKNCPRLLHYDKEPYDIEEIRFLVELGVLDSETMRIHVEPRMTVYFFRGDISFHVTATDTKYLLGIYSFTELGKELLSTIGGSPVDLKFLRRYSMYMNRKHPYLEFTCGYGEVVEGGFVLIPKKKQIFKVPEESSN